MRQYTPVNFTDVKLEGDFWRERLETVLTRTIPSQHRQLAAHGILESLTLPQPPPPLRYPRNSHNFTVQVFWDSDVGKWIEAASYALSHRRDAVIEATDRRDHRAGSPRRSCRTATSTAGTSAASRRSAGPTSATITNSTTPGICSRALSPTSRRPATVASSTSC